MSDPYADAADLYWQAGWRGIPPPSPRPSGACALVLGVIVTIAYGIAMLWSLLSFAGGGQ